MRRERRALCGQSTWPDHAVWRYTDVRWRKEWPVVQEFESGQMVVDKLRHWFPLKLTSFLAGDTFAQYVLYGDKDCFRYAWLMCGADYTLSRDRPAQVGVFEQGRTFARHFVAQRHDGRVYFIHQKKGDDVVPPEQRMLITPKANFVWKDSAAFDYSYCPPDYDFGDVTETEFEIVADPYASFHRKWIRYKQQASQLVSF